MDVHDSHVAVGADFSRIFDAKDFLAMINIPDEALCVLRAHLMLEEYLNLWSGKTTGTEDLYAGSFVPFKTKLVISKNLGMPDELYSIIDKINEIRNRFSHRKGHVLEKSMLDALKKKIDSVVPAAQIQNCDEFQVYASGIDQHGKPASITHSWKGADSRIRFLIIFVIFMLKFTYWIQDAFNVRGIPYEIEAIPKHPAS
ncbi:hypothetical protein [Pseudomonas simiae]|uniref:Apea-like HEPN domain-containing protein n=1 Tax=Pseudomonas simiae TaxID=321846 RepID=A0ABS9G935_9PSED|nr:hypothetical protein [Pseudomonas simiae]MCF5189565.1 hypothetical protein [Pseudomonas simiae]MCF5287837.1 hypothetical protein [Pseudomonas simiae]MCF5321524.1 hypothetical protein [Pseudomonas simiae]MCF5335315.1 hypothetical protein [Pseudomonas simiae]MCF5342741.1 hypothetical protein [Pseudomonas simiae]